MDIHDLVWRVDKVLNRGGSLGLDSNQIAEQVAAMEPEFQAVWVAGADIQSANERAYQTMKRCVHIARENLKAD